MTTFREMTRKHKQLPKETCVDVLTRETRGVLSVLGDEGFPYGMPMNHYYHPDDGCIYFHCGKQKSHRNDAIRKNSKASFCVFDHGYRREGEWSLNVQSVIVFGRIEIIEDWDTIVEISSRLSHKFTQDEAYIQREIEQSGSATLLLKLIPEHMTGKLVNES